VDRFRHVLEPVSQNAQTKDCSSEMLYVYGPQGHIMANTKILLVDDDDLVRSMMGEELQQHGFDVTTVASVSEALKYISSNIYDVLLSDLHMSGACDGLTVVSAMRHTNPKAVTMFKQRSL
jgi:CheY-like chemotaxis protein